MFSIFKKKKPETDTAILQKAERAYQVLNTEAFHEAMTDVEETLWATYMTSSGDDYEARETLYRHIKVLSLIKAQMEATLERGKMAQYKILQEK